MRWIDKTVARLRALLARARVERELDAELQFHLDREIEENLAAGLRPDEARAAAIRSLGSFSNIKDRCRDSLGLRIVDELRQDVSCARRALSSSPGFTAVAILTLALGIGANTAIFSVVNAVMLRPLPYPRADRLVRIWESNPDLGRPLSSVSDPNFLDWRAQARAFSALAASQGTRFTLGSNQRAEIVDGARVTTDFLTVLGISPVLGRNFTPDEDGPGTNVRVAIVSDGLWRRALGSDASTLGRQISLSGNLYTVVGILPPAFRWEDADVLVPLPLPERARGDHQIQVIGRLDEVATLERAREELAAIASKLSRQYPDSNRGWSVRLVPFREWLIPPPVRASLILLLGAIGVVLLIACANVASLVLARAAARQKEIAIRVALGAGRGRIVRQLLTEALLLSMAAGGAGLLLGAAATRLLVTYGPSSVPRLEETSMDLRVLAFGLAISTLTAAIFGLVPALQLSRAAPAAALQDAARGSSGARPHRVRSILTVAEIALSVILLIGAGLLVRSVWQLQQIDPGFEAAPSMMARIGFADAGFEPYARRAFFERALGEVQALPGVVAAAASSGVPLAGLDLNTEVQTPAAAAAGREPTGAAWVLVTPGYFAAMGIPLRGRDFAWRDQASEALTIVISESLAREYWPDRNAIGQPIVLGSFGNRTWTVVGVAGDVRQAALDSEPRPTVYYSAAWLGIRTPMSIVWRSALDPASHAADVRAIVQRIDSSAALFEVAAIPDLVANWFGPRRFNMYLLGIFAGVALVLAAIGLFGVTAYLVSQRTREIGVRLALGADRRDILRLILGRGMALAATGALAGLAAALWLTRLMQSLIFSVSTTDPVTFIAVPIVLVMVALLACYLPARRATRVDPVVALRCE
jgi:predicted permease